MASSTNGEPRLQTRRPYAPRLPPGERREQLLDAALRLIIDQGYAGVSIEAVARVAGVTRPVVYDHFPNLGRLLAALVEREEAYAIAQLEEVIPEAPGELSPADLLATGVQQFLEAVASRPDTWRIILLPLDGTPAIIRQQVERQRARMQERITGLVGWANGLPQFPTGLDVELTGQAIRQLGEEAGRMVLIDPERYSPERYGQFVRTVVRLVWPDDGGDN